MEWILILLVLGFVALVILKGVAANAGGDTNSQSSLGYRKKKTLFTEAERSFLGVRELILGIASAQPYSAVCYQGIALRACLDLSKSDNAESEAPRKALRVIPEKQICVVSDLAKGYGHSLRSLPSIFTFLGITERLRNLISAPYQCLDSSKYRIFGKVRVADILEPNPSKNRSEWQKAFNPIKAKHFDYVICAADTLKPVCAIELDDKSHNQKKRQQRDQLLESVCKDACLPLIRVPAKRSYKLEEVKAMLAKRFANVADGGERPAKQSPSNASTQPVAPKLKKKIKAEETDVPVGEIGEGVR